MKSKKEDWAEISTEDGKSGWVLSRHLSRGPFVSVDVSDVSEDKLNVRRGPGTEYAVIMKVTDHYPLRVIKSAQGWVMVEDFDKDRGWVSQKLVKFEPYVITNLDKCNVRESADVQSRIAFTAERGVILKVLEEKDGWIRVTHSDGDEGWISQKIVFGWLENPEQDS